MAIIKEYYRQNTFFIFAILMFSFGIMKANEHYALMKNALHSWILLFVFCVLWLLHGLKVSLYVLRHLQKPEFEFLYNARLFPRKERLLAFGLMQFILIQLTFLYALVLFVIGITENAWGACLIVLMANIFLILGGVFWYEYKIWRPNLGQNVIPRFFSFNVTIPWVLFYPRHLVTREPVLFILSKFSSILIILLVCYLYPTDDYDIRLISLGLVLVVLTQIMVLIAYSKFENSYFGIYKNMPLTKFNRFCKYLLTIVVILLPEILVLVRNIPNDIPVISVFFQILFLVGVVMSLFMYLRFREEDGREKQMQVLFFSAMFLGVLVMFKVPALLFALVGLGGGYWWFRKRCYEVD